MPLAMIRSSLVNHDGLPFPWRRWLAQQCGGVAFAVKRHFRRLNAAIFVAAFCLLLCPTTAVVGHAADEDDYYRLETLTTSAARTTSRDKNWKPGDGEVVLEVSGLAPFDDERLAVSTRQGDVWLIRGAAARKPEALEFHHYATALHEPMGVVRRGGGLALVQRTELTQLLDRTGDETANEYRTLARGWGVSGNYHEYAYGPKFDGRGDLWLTLNIDLGDER
ncbi:MAG: hypothetical protein KDA41_22340, partial [Planctomycetales bacterium]|nr:hypothetical protein [Planctomycetales bacterium]